MKRILIPDDLGTPKASVARSFAKKGHICDHAWNFRGARRYFKSRYVTHLHQVSSLEEPEKFVNDIVSLVAKQSYDLLLPFETQQLLTLQPHLDQLASHCKYLIPSKKCLDLSNDKFQLHEFCRELNIHTPKTCVLDPVDNLLGMNKELGFPIVLKPMKNHGFATGLKFLLNSDQNVKIQDEPYIAQEFIPGYIHDVNLIARNGEVFQFFTQVRKLMYPIEGGVGAVVFSAKNTVIEKIASKIMRELNWSGMAQLEFKLDPRDGEFKLIEINPRFYGTVDLAIQSGIDFPDLLLQLAFGKNPEKHRPYKSGVRYTFLFGRWTLAILQTLALHGWGEIRDPQKYQKKILGFSWKDPLPDIYSLLLDHRKLVWKRNLQIKPDLPAQFINRFNCHLPEMYV